MAQCAAKTKDGTQCQISPRAGQRYCHVHRRQRLWRLILSFSVLGAVVLGILGFVADVAGLLGFLGINHPTGQPIMDLIAEGDTFIKEGDYEKAIDYYQRALNIDPDDSETWRKTGQAYIGLAMHDTDFVYVIDHALEGDVDLFMQALPYFDRAIKIDPQDKDAYIYRGIIWYRWGNLHSMFGPANNDQNAFSQFSKAISIPLEKRNIDPMAWSYRTSCAYYGLAKVYEMIYEQIGGSSYKEEAEKYLQSARDIVPSCIPP